jgi:hypothetical protein
MKFSRAPGVHHAICLMQRRSMRWPGVRRKHLKDHPTCAVCGGRKKIEVHHVVPFSQDRTKELDADNLISLCDHLRCHLLIGHLGNYRSWNVRVREVAAWLLGLVARRPTLKKQSGR